MSFVSEFKSLNKETTPITSHSKSRTLQVSFLIPARSIDPSFRLHLSAIHSFLRARFQDQFEIIIIPNPKPNTTSTVIKDCEILSKEFSQVRSIPHRCPPQTPGKGAAIFTGFSHSQGKWIWFTDSDLPYGLNFFDRASELHHKGVDFITGNRRLPTSHFIVPVALLKLAASRHRLGLLFNRFARLFLPLHTTDTQAGIKAMTHEFANAAFHQLTCPGFFFDLELFLTASFCGFSHRELEVELHLNTEKSTVRIIRESVLALYWLARIILQTKVGHYKQINNAATLKVNHESKN